MDILKNYEQEGKKYDDSKGDIDTLIILDRSIDFVTPLCTQLTYHGLIDEIFSIKNNLGKFINLIIELKIFLLSYVRSKNIKQRRR